MTVVKWASFLLTSYYTRAIKTKNTNNINHTIWQAPTKCQLNYSILRPYEQNLKMGATKSISTLTELLSDSYWSHLLFFKLYIQQKENLCEFSFWWIYNLKFFFHILRLLDMAMLCRPWFDKMKTWKYETKFIRGEFSFLLDISSNIDRRKKSLKK